MISRNTFKSVVAVAVLCGLWLSAGASTTVRHQPAYSDNDRRHEYFRAVLNLALEETRSDYGDYRLMAAPLKITQERAFELASSGQEIDLFWGMSSPRREAGALAVPFPLLRGLLGNRVLLITPEQSTRFDQVDDLASLRQLTAIQGENWPDTAVLRHNRLPVQSSTSYDSLFEMLKYQRGDYFPRSLAEVWDELESPLGAGTSLYPDLILQYPGPIYFFVSPQNPELAERLQTGLERAWDNGRFNELFYSRPELRKSIEFLAQPDLRKISLTAPWQLPSLERINPDYWLPGSGF